MVVFNTASKVHHDMFAIMQSLIMGGVCFVMVQFWFEVACRCPLRSTPCSPMASCVVASSVPSPLERRFVCLLALRGLASE